MRLFELKNELKSRPIVYVDMDGVLADFFGEVARHHDVPHWKDVEQKGIDQVMKKQGFFANLPPLPNANRLLQGVLRRAGQFGILSSPAQSNVEGSSEEKATCLKQHLRGPLQPSEVLFDHEKFR